MVDGLVDEDRSRRRRERANVGVEEAKFVGDAVGENRQ